MCRLMFWLAAVLAVTGSGVAQAGSLVLDFAPDGGSVSMEAGRKVVSVLPGTTLSFAVTVDSATAESLLLDAFQLNFANSAPQLRLHEWVTGAHWITLDGQLDAPTDTFVAGGLLSGQVEVPPATELGVLQAVVPDEPGEYLLSVDRQAGDDFDTLFVSAFTPQQVGDYGDVLVRVVPEPGTLLLLLAGVFAGLLWQCWRGRLRSGCASGPHIE